MKPVHIFIGGSELLAWTEMTLTRAKESLTGNLSVSLFMGRIPDAPTIVDAAHGREITVYVGGHLAFVGTIDVRRGTGARHGAPGTTENKEGAADADSTRSVSIGPNEYTVQLSCRGKCKVLIDSSHQHPTTNMMQPTDQDVANKLVEPWKIEIDWRGKPIQLDKVRLRDGCRVFDELSRICRENCHFMWETRDGKLFCTDDTAQITGEPLILGSNILEFQAEQSEEYSKAKLKIKSQRTKKDVWGREAIEKTFIEIEDKWVETDIRTIVQHYGDGTQEALERRGRFEANKRSSASKKLTIKVFHVQATNGEPWDIGQLHYVEVPPEGIFDVFECTDLTYRVQNDQTLETTLTLSPPPAGPASGSVTSPTGNLPELMNDFTSVGASRRANAGVTFASGLYPAPWVGPQLTILAPATVIPIAADLLLASVEKKNSEPPKKLPAEYETPTTEATRDNASSRGTR